MDKGKISGDNFYKRIGSARSTHNNSQNNFYIPSNKKENFSTLIQILKSDILSIQEMINSNSNDIKMYKLLSKNPSLTKKLSEIEEMKNVSIFIDKINDQSDNIEKIYKIYGTESANECIQKLFLESGLNDLLMKKIYDFFILMKLKFNNDDSYQETFSKIIPIKEFMEKVPSNNNNENLNLNKKEYVNFDNSEIEDFLKINTLNEVLDDNMKNKKICPHVVKLVDNFFKNLNMKIIENLNNFDIGTNNLNEIKNFKGNQVEKYFKLKNINDNLIEEYKKNIENLLNEEKEKPKFNNEIEKINKEYEQKKEEINKKIDNITKENENLKNNKSSKLDFKYSQKDIDEIKKNTLEEKNKLEDSYKNKINSLNNEIKNLKDKINELTKKENELDEKEININVPKIDINKVTIEKIDLDDFIKKNDSNYINRLVESNEKLDNEISELTTKANKLSGEVSNLKLENSELKRKLDLNQSKNFDEDSYEQVLLKQFEIMKEAFIKKIDNLSIQLSNAKSDSRKKINQIEQNLKESEHLKNIFLQQIISLKKQLGNKI